MDRNEIDNSSIQMLQALRSGAFVEELSATYHQAVQAVADINKPATITVKLTVSPATKGNSAQTIVEDDISLKEPKPDNGGTLFFTDHERKTLSRKDPYQQDLEFRTVAEREHPVKDIDQPKAAEGGNE